MSLYIYMRDFKRAVSRQFRADMLEHEGGWVMVMMMPNEKVTF